MNRLGRTLCLLFATLTFLAGNGHCEDAILTSLVENQFDRDTEYCKTSAQETHGNSVDPTRELNHFLLCLSKKTELEVADPDLQGPGGAPDPELEQVSQALSKILYAPLFREDVHDYKKRLVKRSVQKSFMDNFKAFMAGLENIQKKRFGLRSKRQAPQLDENILSALVNNPEALQLVLDYLKTSGKGKNNQGQAAGLRRPFSTNANRAPERRQDQVRSPFQKPSNFRVQQIHRQQQLRQHQLKQHQLKQQQLRKQQQLKKEKNNKELLKQLQQAKVAKPQQPKVNREELIQQRLQHEKHLRPLVNNKEQAGNPLLNGKFGSDDLQFFGPSDYKPDSPYAFPGGLPKKENGEQVYPWQVGYIPIPR